MQRCYEYRIEIGSRFSSSVFSSTGIVLAENPHVAFSIVRNMREYEGLPVQEIILTNVCNGHTHTWHPSKG